MFPIRDRLPTRTVPFINYALIGLNILAFVQQWALTERESVALVMQWGMIPARLLADPAGALPTVFSSMFLHGGLAHIGGNMLFLWIFGDNVEDALGHARFALFYLLGGVAAALGQIVVDPSSTLPMIGASGAVSAVLAGYVSMYPRARVLVVLPILIFPFLLEFPAWLVILEWFVMQVVFGLSSLVPGAADGGVAWFAHIGGFVAGLLLIRVLMRRRERKTYDPWHGFRDTRPSRTGTVRTYGHGQWFRDR